MSRSAWLAFILRDWRITRSYRFPFAAGLVSSVLTIALFFYLSHIVRAESLPPGAGREQGYFAFAIVGIVVANLLSVGLFAIGRRMHEEQTTGTLEVVAATPAPTWVIALGTCSYEMLYGLASGAVSAVVAVALFDLRFDLRASAVPAVIAAALATFVLVAALGIVIAALTIRFKQTTTIASLMSVGLALLSGVYYPIAALPEPLGSLSWGSPLRWSLDVLRPALFGGHIPIAELGGLLAATAVAVPLSIAWFDRALARARDTGSLAQY